MRKKQNYLNGSVAYGFFAFMCYQVSEVVNIDSLSIFLLGMSIISSILCLWGYVLYLSHDDNEPTDPHPEHTMD